MIDQFQLETIADYLKSRPSVLAGYFYGSKARKEGNAGSDLDIALVFDDKAGSYDGFIDIYSKMTDILRKMGVNGRIDIQPIFPDKSSPLFHFEVIRVNKPFYQRDPAKVAMFEIATLKKYRDYQRLQKIKYYYLGRLYKGDSYGNA